MSYLQNSSAGKTALLKLFAATLPLLPYWVGIVGVAQLDYVQPYKELQNHRFFNAVELCN